MSDFFFLTMALCAATITPFVVRQIRGQIKWEEYCLEQRKLKDRIEAQREAERAEKGFE